MSLERRRLVKGALAAPLILTVRTASAGGKGGGHHGGGGGGGGNTLLSVGACLARDDERSTGYGGPKAVLSKYEKSDNWLRKKVEICKLKWNADNKHDKPDSDFDAKALYVLGFDNKWWKLDGSDKWGKNPKYTGMSKPKYSRKSTEGWRYALVQVDPDSGEVVGFSWENEDGQLATCTCWVSFVAANKNRA